jgi:phage terminase Nu1 subunit (DNA packaging protein)
LSKQNKPLPHWQNQKNAAAGQGVSTQAFARWGVEPVAKIGRNAYYLPSDITAYLVARETASLQEKLERIETAAAETGSAADREKMLLTREQRIGQELKNAQARRELAPIGIIDWALSRVGSQISALLEAIPLKVKQLLPKMTAAEIGLIEREVIKAQNASAAVTVDFDEYDRERDPAGNREGDPSRSQNA